jgi:hypothetical protein
MSQTPSSPVEPPTPGSHYQPALSVVLIIVALFVGATYLMLRTPGAAGPNTATTTAPTTTTTLKHGTTTVTRSKAQVRVQVANGTLTTGLARNYTQQLQTLGWDTLPQLNAARVTTTIVYYNPGFVWAAQEIAGELKVSSSAIRPLGSQIPVAGAAGDDVIVILGPDVAIQG